MSRKNYKLLIWIKLEFEEKRMIVMTSNYYCADKKR